MTEPTLGSYLRGARLGYRWLNDPSVFVKITDLDGGFRIHLAPMGQVPNPPKGQRQEPHRCWWETKDDDIRPELGRIIRQAVAGDLPTFRLRGPLTIDFNDDATLRRTA